MHSVAVHDLVSDLLRHRMPPPAARRRAFAAPLHIWKRVLGFEGCAVQADHAFIAAGIAHEVPEDVARLVRAETARALRHGVLVQRQLAPVAEVAAREGIRVLALKGAARLLAGEAAGTRSIADIDLLVAPRDAAHLHATLVRDLAYTSEAVGAPHHLPGLTRAGHLGIEIHHRLSPDATALDASIHADAKAVRAGAADIFIPSPTAMLLHTLEHAIGVNWTGRYRLRDIRDVADLFTDDVAIAEAERYVRASPARSALETLISAAHEMEPRAPLMRARAWSTVRRVSRTRIALAALPRTPLVAERCFRYAGVVAEGSPRTIWRAGSELVARGRAFAAAGLS